MTQVRTFPSGSSVALQTVNGWYVAAYGGGGGTVGASSGSVGWSETLQLVDLNGGELIDGDDVALATPTGHYLQAYGGGGSIVQATPTAIGAWETFTVIALDYQNDEIGAGDRIARRSTHGYYVVAEGGGGSDVNANRSAIGSWETFTLRATGPAGGGPGPGPGGGSESDTLLPGESLYADQGRTSSNGQYRLVYQGDGNLVLYQGGTPLWASNTAGTLAGEAVMQHDGNFVIYNGYGTPLRDSGTWWSPSAYLVVQNDGNVVVYSAGGAPLWDRYGASW